jgi:hypothetical protein
MIFIHNIKKSISRLRKQYDNSIIIDVSSMAEMPFLKLSPFYPHGDIPVPFSEGYYSQTVEGIWQGLKVFKTADIDIKKFEITKMAGIKRPTRFYGIPLGHRRGINGELIEYYNARKLIYVPTYLWMLENKANSILNDLQDKALKSDIILLDYTTNENIEDLSKPLSHASLIKMVLIENNKSLLINRFSSTNDDQKNGQMEIDFT